LLSIYKTLKRHDTDHFLLVDDLEENLLSLEALLRRDGLVLLKAHSGDEALELLLQNDVALALVDVQMPGLNGFELAELMRGNERTRRVPIIFVTAGNADSQRRFRGYEAGAVDFIHKPIESDILRSKADVFFELYRQRQQIAIQRDELKAHSDALEEADRRKDEFLATLAHELRNPLAPVRHGLDILRKSPDSAEAPEIREMMHRQLVHLVRLIDDLLDVSRVSQGKIELRKKTIQAAEVIRSALESSRPIRQTFADRRCASRTDLARCRPDASGPGRRQPAEQRREIYPRKRPYRPVPTD
jgi:response regulator RpfG family c-di-GMP phosphodiesterase